MDEKLKLHDAEVRARSEAETHKKQCATYTMNILEAVAVLERETTHASEFLTFYDPAVAATMVHPPITAERLDIAASYLVAVGALIRESNQ